MTMLSTSCRSPADHHSEEMNLGMMKVPIQKTTAAAFAPGWASVINTKITVVTMAAAGRRNPRPNCYRPCLPNDWRPADASRARAGRGPLERRGQATWPPGRISKLNSRYPCYGDTNHE